LQWEAVNGEVLTCPAVHASMDNDHQLEHQLISDAKPGQAHHRPTSVRKQYDLVLVEGK